MNDTDLRMWRKPTKLWYFGSLQFLNPIKHHQFLVSFKQRSHSQFWGNADCAKAVHELKLAKNKKNVKFSPINLNSIEKARKQRKPYCDRKIQNVPHTLSSKLWRFFRAMKDSAAISTIHFSEPNHEPKIPSSVQKPPSKPTSQINKICKHSKDLK